MHSELTEALDRRLAEVAAPGAAAALVADGRVVWRGSHGIARPTSGDRVDEQTAFLWFSMTKIATATARYAARRRWEGRPGRIRLESICPTWTSSTRGSRCASCSITPLASGTLRRSGGSIQPLNRAPTRGRWSRSSSTATGSRDSSRSSLRVHQHRLPRPRRADHRGLGTALQRLRGRAGAEADRRDLDRVHVRPGGCRSTRPRAHIRGGIRFFPSHACFSRDG